MEVRKRNLWLDDEVKYLIEVLKEKNIMKLLDGKNKRNRNIFEMIAKEMTAKGYTKNAFQIRDKFKNLKADYFKVKRNNSVTVNQQHTGQYFEMLEDLFGDHPCNPIDMDTVLEGSMDEWFIKIETPEIGDTEFISSNVPEMTVQPEVPAKPETPTLDSETNELPTTSLSSQKSFKQNNKSSYQKVVAQFTKEWKTSQENMLKIMEEQDHKFLKAMDYQIEREREILKEHRLEMAKIMKTDRHEVLGMLNSFLESLRHESPLRQYTTLSSMHSGSPETANITLQEDLETTEENSN